MQIHCVQASSQSSIHLQTSPDKARKHPPHKLLFFSLQFRDITYSPVQIHYIQAGVNTLPTDEHPKQPAYTCRLLLISPESTPLTKLFFLKLLIETDDYRLIQKSAFKFSNILARSTKVHATEKRPKPNTSQFKYTTYRRVQIHYVQAGTKTLHTG